MDVREEEYDEVYVNYVQYISIAQHGSGQRSRA